MKSFLFEREVVLYKLYEDIFKLYEKETIIAGVIKLLKDIRNTHDVDPKHVEKTLTRILEKTETFNVFLSLFELEKRSEWDEELKKSMNDPSYNAHRTIAINICDMYSSGATSFFGYVDCTFKQFFPSKTSRSFLAKGICALIASTAEVIVTGQVLENYSQKNLTILEERGIHLNDMAELVYRLQKPYNPYLTLEECQEHIVGVLRKQQTYHTIQLSVKIDKGVEQQEFGKQFQAIVANDEGLYGIDETLNMAIAKMYGMIAITNFGHADKEKPGIIGALDSDHEENHCNTFADDTVCAIVAAACARLAHNNKHTNSKPKK